MVILYRIELMEKERALVIRLEENYRFISTAPLQPENSSIIVFKEVSEDFSCNNLRECYESIRERLGLKESILFLTSAPVRDYLRIDIEDWATVITTIGLKPSICPSEKSSYHEPLAATVNIAVLVDRDMTLSGLLDLLRTVIEAKSMALAELLLRCDLRSPGTVTDAVAVGRPARYLGSILTAGMATNIGGPITSALYKALVERGLMKIDILYNTLGLRLEEVLDLIAKVYSRAPVPGVSIEVIKEVARKRLLTLLRDPNVVSLLIAARELDLHGASGSIPGLSIEDFKGDSKAIVADELLAFSLSLYISGFKGLLATYWVERLKDTGVLGIHLPLFEDDILSTLVGSILSSIYDELLVNKK